MRSRGHGRAASGRCETPYGLVRGRTTTLPAEGTALRVVLDTNVVMSLWHYRHPRMMVLLAWMERRRAVLLTREECLEELERVLGLKDFDLAPARRAGAAPMQGPR